MSYENELKKVLEVVRKYLPPDGTNIDEAMGEIIAIVDPWPVHPPAITPADMATAFAQGFRDGQAAEHPDTARMLIVMRIADPKQGDPFMTPDIQARIDAEFPEAPTTLAGIRRLLDIAGGAV